MQVLVIDIGGSHVKLALAGRAERARFDSSPDLTPRKLVRRIRGELEAWAYDAVSIGYPGRVDARGPTCEPGNLGNGWVAFDFEHAFGQPVRIVNDAVMQALGALTADACSSSASAPASARRWSPSTSWCRWSSASFPIRPEIR